VNYPFNAFVTSLVYCPDGKNGDCQFFSYFLTATFYFCEAQHVRTVFFGLLIVMMDD